MKKSKVTEYQQYSAFSGKPAECQQTIEIWKPIKGYEDYYEVSNLGRVRSKDRIICRERYGFQRKPGVLMKPTNNGNGYLIVPLNKNGKRKNYYVHRLVADAFIPKIEGKNCVNHLDRNRQNNRLENLEWCNYSENINYSIPYRKKRNNCKKHSIYGLGIKHRKNRFEVSIRNKYLGIYQTLEEAIKARDEYIKAEDEN